jgi:hypothetical protein
MEVEVSNVQLLVFPRDDDTMQSRLARIAAEVGRWERVTPSYLEERLRAFYPGAVVRRQDRLGGLDGGPRAWYVYRDGSPISS